MTHQSILDIAPVIPVVVLDDAEAAVPVAQALARGGLPVVEITLRTPAALEAVRRIVEEVPEVTVGAGTVLSADQLKSAVDAGAQFVVSPGSTPALLDAIDDSPLPALPGVATVSEAMLLRERGRTEMKFFPAEASGGRRFLTSVASPLPDVRFCPTGGITPDTAPDYLVLPNVGCVGGSWLAPADVVAAKDWSRVEALARAASRLRA